MLRINSDADEREGVLSFNCNPDDGGSEKDFARGIGGLCRGEQRASRGQLSRGGRPNGQEVFSKLDTEHLE